MLSLSDFSVTSTADEKNLKLRKSRDLMNSNMYNITLVVPKSVSSKFSSVLNLENSVTGEITKISVLFNPADNEGRPSEPAAAQDWSTEPKETRSKPQFDTPTPKAAAFKERESPRFISYMVFLFVVCIVIFLAKDT